MNKTEFLDLLENYLKKANVYDKKHIQYFDEVIEDYIEDGYSEQEAVEKVGKISDIVENIILDVPNSKVSDKNGSYNATSSTSTPESKDKWLTPLLIILALIGIPIWVPLIIAALVTAFALAITAFVVVLVVPATLIVTIGFTGISLFIAGLYSLIYIPAAFKAPTFVGFFQLGDTLLLIGIGFLLIIAVVATAVTFVNLIVKFLGNQKAINKLRTGISYYYMKIEVFFKKLWRKIS